MECLPLRLECASTTNTASQRTIGIMSLFPIYSIETISFTEFVNQSGTSLSNPTNMQCTYQRHSLVIYLYHQFIRASSLHCSMLFCKCYAVGKRKCLYNKLHKKVYLYMEMTFKNAFIYFLYVAYLVHCCGGVEVFSDMSALRKGEERWAS